MTGPWLPLGKFVLVELHKASSSLEIAGESKYSSFGTVLAVGPAVESVAVGDTVLVNGAQGVIGHAEFGEGVALVPEPLLLAKREPASLRLVQ